MISHKKSAALRISKLCILLVFSSLFLSSLFAESISPDKAVELLKKGNSRYVSGALTNSNLDKKRRESTVRDGQHPFATIITCSDSRVPLEHVFDAGIGDIFVVRVAGNVIDVDEAGSIEYGVDHLRTPVFVVLGHTNCGAVTAVTKGAHLHGNIPPLVDNILPAVKKAKAKHGDSFSPQLLSTAIENNVWQSIEDLFKTSHISLELVKKKELKVIGAVYDLTSGKVNWLGEHPEQNRLLTYYDSFIFRYIDRIFGSAGGIAGLLLIILTLIVFIIINRVFFNEKTRNKKYQIMARLKWSNYSLVIGGILFLIAASLMMTSFSIVNLARFLIVLALYLILSLVYSSKFSVSMYNSFKKVITALKGESQ